MAKQDLTGLSVSALLALAGKEPGLIGDITAEIERRNNLPSQQGLTVDFNSSGGVMVMESGKTTLSSKGTLYRGSVNMPVNLAELLAGDSPESIECRKMVMALIRQPKDVIAKRVAEKQSAKLARLAAESAQPAKS